MNKSLIDLAWPLAQSSSGKQIRSDVEDGVEPTKRDDPIVYRNAGVSRQEIKPTRSMIGHAYSTISKGLEQAKIVARIKHGC